MRDDIHSYGSDDDFCEHLNHSRDGPFSFKAMPLNKKILEAISKLPEVIKRNKTHFDEFQLSKSNVKYGKKTLEESLINKENEVNQANQFRAKSFDRSQIQ